MPTFRAIVLSKYLRKDKTFPIKIRVTHKRKKRFIDTGLVATIDDLTRKYKIRSQVFIDSTDEMIKGYRDRCNENYLEIAEMDVDQVVSFLLTKEKPADLDFLEFGKSHAEKIAASGRVRTAGLYTTTLNALKRFTGRESLHISEINVRFLQSFEGWIRLNPIRPDPKSILSMSRAPSLYLASIRALHNEMKLQYNDEDAGIIQIPYSPFAKYKVPVPPATQKRALSAEIIRKIAELQNEPVKNSKGTNLFNLAKDCFILSFCLIGMNSADLYHCTDIRDDKIYYKRKKTRSRRKDEAMMCVFIPHRIVRLVSDYRVKTGKYAFIFSQHYATEGNFNKAINKGLKDVGKKVGIGDLQFYAARHSWATIAMNKAGIDKYTVHAALNHVDPEMKVTDIYLEKDWSVINDANRKVLDFVFKTKSQDRNKPGLR